MDSDSGPSYLVGSLVYVLLLGLANASAFAQVSFDKPDIDVGRGPVSIVQADFNGDGRPDLVTANSKDNTVSVLLNNGDGTFHRQDYLTALHPNVVVAADFNGDGIPDVAAGGDTGITLFFGMKDGGLSRVAFIATPDEVTGMVAADFDGDGHLDLATVRGRTGVVSIYTGTGSTTFFHVADYATVVRGSPLGFPGAIPALGFSSTIAAADFNRDGILDLAVANGNSTSAAIFLGLGGGAFTSAPDIVTSDAALVSIAVTDFTRDGVPDLWVITEICDGEGCSFFTNIYAGQGDGSFVLKERFFRDSNASVGAPAFLDLNGDGIPDIATPTLFAGVEISITDPQGPFFLPSGFFLAGVGVTSLAVADFNGDGIPDIATANAYDDTVTILMSDGHGQLHSHLRTPMSAIFYGAIAADLNRDGLTDIVFLGNGFPGIGSGIWAALGSGNGVFSKPQETQADFAAFQIAIADVNRDGIPDLIAIGNDMSSGIANPATRVLLGKGDGTFSKAFQFAGAGDKLLVADFNGDGVPDILVRYTNLGVSLGNGDGTFRLQVETPYFLPGCSAGDMAAGDFDGDRKTDVIIAYNYGLGACSTPQLKLFSGNGDGVFRPGRTLATFPGEGIQFVVAADFNRDGLLDFVVAHGPALTLFLGNGDGTFRQGASIPLRNAPGLNGISGLQVADLNNDGLPDLVISSDCVSVLVNNGDGTFQPRQDFPIGGVGALVIADFTNDGKPDIASFTTDLAMLVNTTTLEHPDFKFALHANQASLASGQSQTIGGIVASLGAFDRGISFSCDGLPRGASCRFDPPNLALTANATASVALTISTTGTTATARPQSGTSMISCALLFPAVAGLIVGLRKKKRAGILAIVALGLAWIPLLQGCKAVGDDHKTVQETAATATPAGTYTITVTAQADGPEKTTHTQTVLLTVR